jgi:hypothetical protein
VKGEGGGCYVGEGGGGLVRGECGGGDGCRNVGLEVRGGSRRQEYPGGEGGQGCGMEGQEGEGRGGEGRGREGEGRPGCAAELGPTHLPFCCTFLSDHPVTSPPLPSARRMERRGPVLRSPGLTDLLQQQPWLVGVSPGVVAWVRAAGELRPYAAGQCIIPVKVCVWGGRGVAGRRGEAGGIGPCIMPVKVCVCV